MALSAITLVSSFLCCSDSHDGFKEGGGQFAPGVRGVYAG